MAHVQPSMFAGSSMCDFCMTAPATVLVNGHLACERHKNSEVVEVESFANSGDGSGGGGGGGGGSGGGKRGRENGSDDGDDVLEVWDPPAAVASVVPPTTPPSEAPLSSAIFIDSSNSSSSSSSSSSIHGAPVGNAPAPSQKSSAPVIPASLWGSPAAPLALSDDNDDDDHDDDHEVRFTGTTLSSDVVDLAGGSKSPVRGVNFSGGSSSRRSSGGRGSSGAGGSSSSGGGGGSSEPNRDRRRSLQTPTGTEIVDLAAASSFFDLTPARGGPNSLVGSGSGGGGGRRPVLGTMPEIRGGGGTTSTKRRGPGKADQTGAVRAEEREGTTAEGASAGAIGAGGASSSSSSSSPFSSAVTTKSVPSATKAGKGRPKKRMNLKPEVPCIVCFEDSAVDKCARCPEGHAMCKQCVTSYVTETLMPQGTIFWDTIKCGGSSTCGHLFGPSVTALLPRAVVRKIETKQMDVAHLVAGERDPTSDKWISKHSKDCPNCGVPIQRSSGCMHMTCAVCRHNFWYTCACRYPGHTAHCTRRGY